MSCKNWERGTIKIPADQWSAFRTRLLQAWNEGEEKLLVEAKKLHGRLKEAAKGKRGETRLRAMKDALHKGVRDHFDRTIPRWSHEGTPHTQRLEQLLFVRKGFLSCERDKLQAPKRKDLNLVAVTRSASVIFDEAGVYFDNATKSVTWSVGEANHAVENANDHWFAKKLFAALRRIRWTRGSGGRIVGNDEYNQEERDEGGGANYVTAEYGPGVKCTSDRCQSI